MTDEPAPRATASLAAEYAAFCERVADACAEQAPVVDALIDAMARAGAIHCYGFGRSGSVAASLAIRLRHFQRRLPPAWWVGDLVRNPFRAGDLLIVVSRTCERFELLALVAHARGLGMRCAFVTGESHGAACTGGDDLVISLPGMESEAVYGGGDFELAAFFFQEVLVARAGALLRVDRGDVARFHVY